VSVNVSAASQAQQALIEGLMQFYIYDFSEMEPPESERFVFDDEGRFAPYPELDRYWRLDGFHPLLIEVGGRVVGFALINTHSHRGGTVERSMAEFFVARGFRRRGAAGEAVRQILERFPGRWEVAVAERNIAARTFWPRAIAAAPNVSGLTQLAGDGEHWRGPIWTFEASPSP
jgi:predicted acetyltransferase